MGQLEKYGLYVLCLVIFLILGVAMWGDPPSDVIEDQLAQQEKVFLSPEEYTDNLDNVLAAQQQEKQDRMLDKQRRAEDAAGGLFLPASETDTGQQTVPPAEEIVPPAEMTRGAVALRTHVVVQNDNYGMLAQRYLGSARFGNEIEKANPGIDPTGLQIGMEINIPDKSLIANNTTTSTSPRSRVYTVQRGDSLWKIAEKHYGANRADAFVAKIKVLNNLSDDLINPGDEIKLPIE